MEGSSGAPAARGPGVAPQYVLPEQVYIKEKDAAYIKQKLVQVSQSPRVKHEFVEVVQETLIVLEPDEELVEVKEEPGGNGVSVAAARAGLYTGHEVRDELVLGPVCLERSTPQAPVEAEAELLERQTGRGKELWRAGRAGGGGRARTARRPRGGQGGGQGGWGAGKTGRSKKRKAYSRAQLNEALNEIKHGTSLYAASKRFRIPETTLRDKRDGKSTRDVCGPRPVLTVTEEHALVHWVHYLGKSGFDVTKERILQEVTNVVKNLNRPNPFKNDVPGKSWFQKFLKRHPAVAIYVARSKKEVSGAGGRAGLRTLERYLTARDLVHVLQDPTRIFNCDEVSLFLRPKKKALVGKGRHVVWNRVEGDEKECLSVILNVSAAGRVAPPMTLYPDTTVPKAFASATPEGWACCGTDTGGATAGALHEYITACFHPWLVTNRAPTPVVLFLDPSVHISIALSVFCKEKAIILLAFLPASRVSQPLAPVFRTIEETWPGIVRIHKKSASLKRTDFAAPLKTCLECLTPEIIQSGFRSCGLYPFEPSSVPHEEVLSSPDEEELKDGVETVSLASQSLASGDRTDSGESIEEIGDSDQLGEASAPQESRHSVSPQEPPSAVDTLRLRREILHVPEMVANKDRGHCRVCLRRDILKKLALKCSPCEVSLCPGGCWRQWHSAERPPLPLPLPLHGTGTGTGRDVRDRKSKHR